MKNFEEKMIKDLKDFLEKKRREILEYNINDNMDTYKKINEIYNLINDYYYWGAMTDLETGETFTLSIGVREIDKLLMQITDEKYLEYELKRKEEMIQKFERKLKEMNEK